MPLSLFAYRRQNGNMRRVTNKIAASLDEDVTLEDLAAATNLSPAHMVRQYSRLCGESPMQTLRRLRLQRAFDLIGKGPYGRFTAIGFAAGYGSSAAFTHAFRKQFGMAPSDVPSIIRPAPTPVPLHLEYLPERKVWQTEYEGLYAQNGWYKANLVWQCTLAGRDDLFTWRINDRDHPFSEKGSNRVKLTHFLPVQELASPLEADLAVLPGGHYVVTETVFNERTGFVRALEDRIRDELGCKLIDRPSLEREPAERCWRVPQERRVVMYLPVEPIDKHGRQLCQEAEAMGRRKF
ncbi:helix-turn-helix transcriptional regulator [Uliginosibacterium aquaticum]|uniref:Helix-turn-helix transcriptional regulator n=1 Tax=Uliginosibacterium aquaticum TaxID=2731212 RepID=A0ABX2IKU0_9RHOO|nr:AraC family transcriptional regulator [Uliginosibacterium aquaticum]NSL55647.1 helix-turn-helix transcriptional regulator [Uliginosibacterium aquaticum]